MSFAIRIANSDVGFSCEPGQSVLDAALKAGIELPYSCRKGVCGNCAGGVVQGGVRGLAGAPLRNEFCEPGQVLLCQCEPLADAEIAPTSFRRVDPASRVSLRAKVFRNQRVADDVSILQLRLPAGKRVKFRAGQYLQLALPDGTQRSYSMANPPHESDEITLHVRHVPGGLFTALVPELKPGDMLDIELPFGDFSLREDSERPIVFVAGGTGFSPIKSILDDMARRGVKRQATLFWGARRAEHLYLLSAVERWKRALPAFRFVPAVSEGEAGERVFCGLVHEAMMAECPTLAGHEVYCCGAPGMVAAVRDAAAKRGLDRHDFFSDVFVSGADVAQAQGEARAIAVP